MNNKHAPTVVVLHNQIVSTSAQDELDVLVQVETVSEALSLQGYDPVAVPVSLDLQHAMDHLRQLQPKFVFNLVESIGGTGRFIYFAPAMLDHLQIPYSGCSTDALYITTNKLLSKVLMRSQSIATPAWMPLNGPPDVAGIHFEPAYILKPVWEDASVGLDDASVFTGKKMLRDKLQERTFYPGAWFVEAYIPGREFNISILGGSAEPLVLPVAEIEFVGYPQDKPRIVDYRAKWETDSFEYQHTQRRFDYPRTDEALITELQAITLKCWEIFGLRGYARVDFRVDQQGIPWVLEVNANPCISPDSGFVAAAERAGLDFNTVIRRIIADIPGEGY